MVPFPKTPHLGAVLAVLLAALPSTSGCMSRCMSDADCVKSCPCENGDNCTVGLSCVNTVCEPEETPICQIPEDFCTKYSAKGLCGSKKCERTEDCRKKCNCSANLTVNNQTTTCCYKCANIYSCLDDEGLCDQAYASDSCDTICGRVGPIDTACNLPEGSGCEKVTCQGFLPGQTN